MNAPPPGPPGQQVTFFTDQINDTSGHSGATCPFGKTCYDTTYTYTVRVKDVTDHFSPKSNSQSGSVPRPKKK